MINAVVFGVKSELYGHEYGLDLITAGFGKELAMLGNCCEYRCYGLTWVEKLVDGLQWLDKTRRGIDLVDKNMTARDHG